MNLRKKCEEHGLDYEFYINASKSITRELEREDYQYADYIREKIRNLNELLALGGDTDGSN